MKFEKVSYEQFRKDLIKSGLIDLEQTTEATIKLCYENIKIPTRATKYSAGYDFYLPITISKLARGGSVLFPTGIKVKLDNDCVLFLTPRSSLGIEYGMQLANTMGVIDADYYNNDNNEGHIWCKIQFPLNSIYGKNENYMYFPQLNKEINLEEGTPFLQGIIVKYYTSDNDNVDSERKGGIGSTDKRDMV